MATGRGSGPLCQTCFTPSPLIHPHTCYIQHTQHPISRPSRHPAAHSLPAHLLGGLVEPAGCPGEVVVEGGGIVEHGEVEVALAELALDGLGEVVDLQQGDGGEREGAMVRMEAGRQAGRLWWRSSRGASGVSSCPITSWLSLSPIHLPTHPPTHPPAHLSGLVEQLRGVVALVLVAEDDGSGRQRRGDAAPQV